ncbi:MAG: hypothetical protein ACR2IR_13965 [Acidimicrobiia bacterium]
MNLEDRIRSSLHTAADGARPTPGAWQDVRQSAAARRRRSQTVGYALAGIAGVAAVAGAVVGLAVLRDGGTGNVTAAPASTRPREIAAVVDGKVVVLSSEDGQVVRTLAEGADADGASTVAVSADGKTVYFTRADPDARCERDAPPQIVSVPIDGGPVTIVASGRDPIVSPDGRYLAYATGGPDQCGSGLLAVQELRTDRFAQDLFPVGDAPPAPLEWSPDSTRILFGFEPVPTFEIREVDLEAIRRREPARTLPLPEGVYLAANRGDEGSLAAAQLGGARRTGVIEVDAVTGKRSRALFDLSGAPVVSLDADSTGRHILAVALAPLPDAPPVLTRWSEGEKPRRLLEGVDDAAWVPDTARTDPPPTAQAEPDSATPMPATIVAARSEGGVGGGPQLVELSSSDGRVTRPLGSGAPIEHLEIASDGKVYFEQDPANCPGSLYSGELTRLHRDREPLFFEFLAQYARWPAVSPDGQRLAYVQFEGCGEVVLALRDLATGAERSLAVPSVSDGGPPYELVGPLVWDADSLHLIVPVNREPVTERWYIDVDAATTAVDGRQLRRVGEQGGPVAFAPLGAAGRFAAAVADADDESALRIVELDVVAGTEVRMLVELGDRYGVVQSLASDPSGAHLLFVASDTLYRWSEGDPEPTKVADEVSAADW